MAFPTETVYGLGASAFNGEAMERIYEVKGRGEWKPLTVHIADRRDIEYFAKELTPRAEKLISVFWPGPLTIVVPKREDVPREITRSDRVGLRMPDHPIALALIGRSGPLVAPSANLSGHPSPTTAKMVMDQLGEKIDCLIDGGQTPLGIESTVVDVSDKPVILRTGLITVEAISEVLGEEVEVKESGEEGVYSPLVLLVEGEELERTIREVEAIKKKEGKKVGIIASKEFCRLAPAGWKRRSWGDGKDLMAVARKFFYVLDEMKDRDILVVENLPPVGIGMALRSRLEKLAKKR